MTIGIYRISWRDIHYIGQSVNIENRLKTHLGKLSRGLHTNNLMQSTYYEFGRPDFAGLICEVPENELNSAEAYFVEEYDSYAYGLNKTKGGGTRGGGPMDKTWRPSYAETDEHSSRNIPEGLNRTQIVHWLRTGEILEVKPPGAIENFISFLFSRELMIILAWLCIISIVVRAFFR